MAGTDARLYTPRGLNVNDNGSLLIADHDNQRIRQLSPSGGMTTFAGRTQYGGDGGQAVNATLFQPQSVALDPNSNLLFTDRGNNLIRTVDSKGGIRLYSGKPGQYSGFGPNSQVVGPLAQVLWNDPHGIAVNADGATYVIDSGTATPRVVDTKSVVGVFGISGSHVRPTDTAINPANSFVTIADPDGDRLHRVNLGTKNATVLGSSGAFAGDGAPVVNARFKTPEGVGYDASGSLWIADSAHHRLRRADASDTIRTMVGTGLAENTGDFGPASAASIYYPMGIAFSRTGTGFVSTAHCIRALFPDGTIATIAGTCSAGAFSGDGGAAITARLNAPQGMAVDSSGRVFFADSGNHRIRVLTPIPALRLEIVSGDKQSRLATAPLDRPLVVRLLAQGSIVYPFAPAAFSVSQGGAALSSTVASTGPDGIASITATLGASAGTVAVTASVPGVAPVTFTLTARPVPSIALVGGGAGNNPAAAPGSLMLISGANFDPAAACLYINDAKVPMLEVAANRIVAQVPPVTGDLAPASVSVSGDCATTGEVRSAAASLPLAIAAPEFYYWRNKSVQAVVADTDVAIGPAALLPTRTLRPARPGDIVAIMATGFGPTDPPLDPGVAAAGPAGLTLPVKVTLGDLTISPDDIVYAGPATGKLGQYELRIRIPSAAPSGDLSIRITVGDSTSPDTATLTVENANPTPARQGARK